MSKRILSICLAVLIMVMALPVTLIAPITASAATEEINLSALNFPERVVEKVMHNFDNATDANIGAANKNNPQGFIDATTTGTAFSFENGAAKLSISADSKQPYVYFYFSYYQNQNQPTTKTKYLSFHVDFTGVTSIEAGKSIGFRTAIGGSKGQNGVYTNYGQCNQTYYYISDKTGEVTVGNSGGGTNIWNAQLYGKAGESGTFIIPMDMWSGEVYDSAAGTGDEGIAFDIAKLPNRSGNGYYTSRLMMDFRTVLNANDYVYYDDFEWLIDNPLSGVYTTALMAEDFSDAESATVGGWSNNPENWATIAVNKDGKLEVSALPADEDDSTANVTWGSRQTVTVGNLKSWAQNATAFAYDLDLSEIEGRGLTLYHRFYETGSNGSVAFAPWGNTVYLYGEDGKLTTVTADKTEWNAGVSIPQGFKGTVIIPVESMRASASDTAFSGELYNVPNYTVEIETKGYGTEENADIDADKSVYYDNFSWYVEPVTPESGTTFSATENSSMSIKNAIMEPVKTVEMWVKTSATTEGTILNKMFRDNGASATSYNLNVAINAAGNPVYNIADGHGNYAACTFTDVTVNNGNWTHLAFVQKAESIDLYVNSALAQSIAATDFNAVVNGRLTVGHVFGNSVTGKTKYFDGEIAELRLWSTVRTPYELYNNAMTAFDTNGLIASWALWGDEPFANRIATSDYDIVEYDYETSADDAKYAEYSAPAADDEYSVVFLPDTQIVNRHYKEDFPGIYDWIIENKDKYNIEAVMSLGDITNDNDDDLTLDGLLDENGDGEWGRAAKQFDRLTDAGIPWTVIPGNHDCKGASVGNRNYANLNAAFPLSKISQFSYFGGSYTTDSVVNSYYYLTMGGTKYLLLCLDQEPRAGAIDWAAQVVAANPDCRVIITTHIYMTSQGVDYTAATSYTSWATQTLKDKLISKYENIDMVICGHSSTPNILTRTLTGANGNEVLEVIVDTQAIDYTYKSASCVAVATFSADGNTVRWNLYSTAQDLYLDEDSQFTTTLDAKTGAPIVDALAAEDTFVDPYIVRDFTTFDITPNTSSNNYTSSQLTMGKGVASQSISLTLADNASIVNRQLKVTPSTSGRFDLSFKKLPNLVAGNEYNAFAFYVDFSEYKASETPSLKLNFREYSKGSNETTSGTVYYTLTVDGKLEKHINSGSCEVPSQFKGYVIFPFDNTWSSGEKTAADFIYESQKNDAIACIRIMKNPSGSPVYFDNFLYLKNFSGDVAVSEEAKSITITDSIAVDYKLDSEALAEYTDVRAEFELNGVVTEVNDYEVDDNGNYVFSFKGISPKNVSDTITATYHATKDGVEYTALKQSYSVAKNCYNLINNYTGENADEVVKVCKELLNFASASQVYHDYNKENLVNADLADEDKTLELGRTPQSITAFDPFDGEITAKFKSASVNLKSNVAIRFVVEAEDISDMRVKLAVGDEVWYVFAKNFVPVEGYTNRYYVYFNKLGAAAMSDEVVATIENNKGVALGKTLHYSIESYAASKWNSEDTALQNLVKAMMCYGDASKALEAKAAQ